MLATPLTHVDELVRSISTEWCREVIELATFR